MANDDNKKLMILGAGLFLFFLSTRAKAGTTGGNGGVTIPGAPGSLNESYLGIEPTATNRGIRNNNPGNIKFSRYNNWQGKVPEAQNTDAKVTDPQHSRFGQPTFEQNFTWAQGIRMMIHLIKNSYIPSGRNTINKIMDGIPAQNLGGWSAGNENYKNHLATKTGKTRTQTISATDEATIKNLIIAMANFENGHTGPNDIDVIHSDSYDTARTLL